MKKDDGLSPDGRFVLVPKPDYPRIESCHWNKVKGRGKEPVGEVKELDMNTGPKGKK